MRKSTSGFTIVELLIVIVVIAILAAISLVAYSGIQDRALASVVNPISLTSPKRLNWQKWIPATAATQRF